MKVTVKDCLELPVFQKAVLIAGNQGLDNRVTAVSFFEAGSLSNHMADFHKKNELVLTASFFDVLGEEAQIQTVRSLADHGEAALILLAPETKLESMPRRVLALANELKLPMLVVPPEPTTTYSDIVNEVMEKVLYGDNFANRLISNTIFHLLNFEKHSNFQSAAREAAINNNFQMVILSEDFNPIFSVETRHRTTIAEAIREGIERDVDKSAVYTRIDINGALTYWGPVTINGEKHYMFIVDNEDSYSPGEITKLAEILEIAMGMWKYSPVKDAKAEFIKALRRGNKSLAYCLKDEAMSEGAEILSVFCITGVERDDSLKKITSFEKRTGYEVLKIHEGDEIFGMILKRDHTKSRVSCTELYQELPLGQGAMIFHVTGLDGMEGCSDAFQLINEAWPFIQYIFPHMNVFTKYELALASNCINISIKSDTVKKNYMDLIAPFKTSKEGKSKQLLETLEIFVLDAGMNTSKTAKLMNIHTNTVQYRLKRIREILQADMMGTSIIPGLTVALAVERIEKITRML
ncbi:PucR family transcriptional regulator [Anoxybacterium hadale]|uniref:PucR family transcriptional regulator n=1 Tax=Anoxybacterium hadale TaxID=3408580 RepID=A0ACD1AFN8_9FIRM|nr:PucR family transcriptional regulator [Clostridiales bacterium]